jgi:hypothetical protein
MLDRAGNFLVLSRTRVATACAALLMSVMVTATGWPQAAPPSSAGAQGPAQQTVPARPAPNEPPPPPSPQPVPEENPGLINELGKLWDKSKSMLPTIKSPQETIEDLNAKARDAGESLSRVAKPAAMVTGRMGCPASDNGAPDCKAGADKLCQAKGYKEGKSLDTDAAEKCSPKVFLPGRKREPGDCKTENYVTRALCQ